MSEALVDALWQRLARLDVAADAPLLVMLSGGGDSTALLLALAQRAQPSQLHALHVNYGLRGRSSEADAEFCAGLCRTHGVALTQIDAAGEPRGNLQDWARKLRYEEAERQAERLGPQAVIVSAHTADDQAETVLYRLFASPGRRALAGIPARRGRIVRPLLDTRRGELRRWLTARGQEWREDASNADPRFARVRARALLKAAEELHPAAVANLLQTTADLAAEGRVLDALVAETIAAASSQGGAAIELAALAELPEALGGAALRSFVEQQSGHPVPKAVRALPEALRLAQSHEPRELQIEGARLAVHRGLLRVVAES